MLLLSVETALLVSHGRATLTFTTFVDIFPLLMLWCVFAWDRYWSAAIGNGASEGGWKPIDYIMSKLWPVPAGGFKLRLWGTVAMGLRMMMLIPFLVTLAFITDGNPWYSLLSVFLGVPYLLWGYLVKVNVIRNAELTVGALVWQLICLSSTI